MKSSCLYKVRDETYINLNKVTRIDVKEHGFFWGDRLTIWYQSGEHGETASHNISCSKTGCAKTLRDFMRDFDECYKN